MRGRSLYLILLFSLSIVVASIALSAWFIAIPGDFVTPVTRASSSVKLSIDQLLEAQSLELSRQSTRYSYFQAVGAIVSALVGGLTMLAAIAAALYAKAAADEARRSAEIARNAFVASERAWVNADLIGVDDILFAPDGTISTSVEILIKNIGKTPALNVHTHVDIIFDHNKASELIKEIAHKQRIPNAEHSRLLLPGDEYLRPWGPSAHPIEQQFDVRQGFMLPAVIGVVSYQTHPDMAVRQTGFAKILSRNDDSGSFSGLITYGIDVPKEVVQIDATSGGFAD